MILKKVINSDGKVSYVEISFEDAVKVLNRDDLVFTDEDEQEDFEDYLDDLEDDDEDEVETREQGKAKKTEFKGNFADGFAGISKIVNDALNTANMAMNSVFNGGNQKCSSKMKKLMSMLPFMDEEDIYEIAKEILNKSPEYEDLNLSALMPFLSNNHCDELFMIAIKSEYKELNPVSLAPFVSSECLDRFADAYIEGKFQDVSVDGLYPFMNEKTIKKLFKYLLMKK